ncbi:MAG: DUF3576 domain-containing protein [Proteobacteria bacterium]|jgi:hypothetical protein|nr:DUF3576 domain-containing protein [Pseudomonadota bacterium]MDA1239020.1 DUF3576 domain-containing protein [Pseudomonadota bacterium]
MKRLLFLIAGISLISLSACGGGKKFFGDVIPADTAPVIEKKGTNLSDILKSNQDPNTAIGVNRYLWIATLEVLNFMPIEAADPFTGVISYGYGSVPGSSKLYRGTVLINDPALDGRSLKVFLQPKSGTADLKTIKAVENAILNRARQIYQSESKL